MSNFKFEPIESKATFAPWASDAEFMDIVSKIDIGYTKLDKYRLYALWDLVDQMKDKEGSIIEIGCWRGGSGALMAKKAQSACPVYLCDTFSGIVKVDREYDSIYFNGKHNDATPKQVSDCLELLGVSGALILHGVFPEETAKEIPKNEKFKLCHLDVDVYWSGKDALDWIWPKLIPGGVIVFDDYGFGGCDGITKLVEDQRSKKDRLIVYNLNGQALLIKLK